MNRFVAGGVQNHRIRKNQKIDDNIPITRARIIFCFRLSWSILESALSIAGNRSRIDNKNKLMIR